MIKSNNFKTILKKIFGSENQTFRGSHMADSFSSYIKGYDDLKKAALDSMSVYIEIDRIFNALYPPIKIPGHRPGYYSFSDDYFEIKLKNKKLEEHLSKHFLDKNYSDKIYGGSYDLGMFFQSLCRELLINGVTYYAISWGKVKIENTEYILPTDFNYLHPATISIDEDINDKFTIKQRYPIWSILTDGLDGVFNRNIKCEDALFLTYLFSQRSPVKESLKFLPSIKKFYNFGLNQGESYLNGKNHSLPIEMARYKTYSEEKRKLDYSRIKIRRLFNYLYEDQNLTSYYDVFTVVRYKKYLNDMRHYFLNEFNRQVMDQVLSINSLKETPNITLKDEIFVSNDKLDIAFEKFKKKEISVNEFSKLVNDNLDKTSMH